MTVSAGGWYYVSGKTPVGPVERTEIERLIAMRRISGESLVWTRGMAGWEPASNSFQSEFSAMPPPILGATISGTGASSGNSSNPLSEQGNPGTDVGAPSRALWDSVGMCLRKYAVFSGRASRSEFWYFVLFLLLVLIIAPAADFIYQPNPGKSGLSIQALASLFLYLPMLSVSVRRLHDIDRTGWWVGIVGAAPIVVFLGMIVLVTVGAGLAQLGDSLIGLNDLGTSLQASTGETANLQMGTGPSANESLRNEFLALLLCTGVLTYMVTLLVFHCQRGTVGKNRYG